jgi:hypothetical protein
MKKTEVFPSLSVLFRGPGLQVLYTAKDFTGPLALLPCHHKHARPRASLWACGLISFDHARFA